MRKRLTTTTSHDAPHFDEGWLDLDRAAIVEVTSEEKEYPVEFAPVLILALESTERTQGSNIAPVCRIRCSPFVQPVRGSLRLHQSCRTSSQNGMRSGSSRHRIFAQLSSSHSHASNLGSSGTG